MFFGDCTMQRITLTTRFICFSLMIYANAETPGIKSRITQKGIDFLTDAEQVMMMLPTIPDFEESTEISVLGVVDYKVHDIHIKSLLLTPRSVLIIEPDVGLAWHGEELRVKVIAKWDYQTHSIIPLADSGAVELKVTIKTSPFKLKVGVNDSGRLFINLLDDDCHFSVTEIDLDLQGGKEWLYNLFESNVEEALHEEANKQICLIISDFIRKDLADAMATMDVTVPLVSDEASLDLSLLPNPGVTSFLDLGHRGKVNSGNEYSDKSLEIAILPVDPEESHMFYIWLTNYVLNSAGVAFQDSDYLKYSLTEDQLPVNSTISLNTSSYEMTLLLPQISKLHPDTMIRCDIYPTEPPAVRLTKDFIQISISANIEVHLLKDSGPIHAVTVGKTIEMTGTLSVDETDLRWTVSSFSCGAKLLLSNIDGFDFDIVNNAIKFACHAFIKQYINDMGLIGIPLPELPGDWVFTNPSIAHGEGFIKLGMDLKRRVGD